MAKAILRLVKDNSEFKTDIPLNIPSWLNSTKLVMPNDLNPAGNLFGGTMMSWMDKVSAMLATQVSKGNVVTASVSEISFKSPVKLGEQVTLTALLTKLGNSSMEILVKADALSFSNSIANERPVAQAQFNFVHLGEDGKPKTIKR